MGKKYYAVRRGHVPGIYLTWPEAEAQVKGFPGARHKSFNDRAEAEHWLKGDLPPPPTLSQVHSPMNHEAESDETLPPWE